MRLRSVAVLGIATGLAVGAGTAQAQQRAIQQRLVAAKQQIMELNADSAAVLLRGVLSDPAATSPQRSWAYSLMALTRLAAQDENNARVMFQTALNMDPKLPGDSIRALLDLDSQAEVVYRQALAWYQGRAGVAAAAAPRDSLRVQFTARDTILASGDSLFAIVPRPNRNARTTVTVAAVGAPAGSVTAEGSLAMGAAGPLRVNLRRADGRPIFQPGQNYVFTIAAVDSFGMQDQRHWTMRLDTLAAVTQPLPAPVAESAFRPETLQVKSRSPASLVAGLGLGAVAAVLPTALGQSKLNSGLSGDGTAYLVAGSAAVAGIVGYLSGTRAQFQPANAQYNERLRRDYEQRAAAVRAANEQARQRPRIQVRLVPETNR